MEAKKKKVSKLIYPELSYKITGILYKVHNALGRYRSEKECADLFEDLLKEHGFNYKREFIIENPSENNNRFRNKVDFLIEDKIIIELKCKRVIEKENYYQVMRYLTALNKKLGIIANFREKHLKPRRVLNPDYR